MSRKGALTARVSIGFYPGKNGIQSYELSAADLEAIGGGDWDCWTVCTGRCGRYNDCPHDRF